MPPCIQSEFCICDFVPSREGNLMGHTLLLYFYALRFIQKMKLYGSLNDDNSVSKPG